ncbi:MAG TPA: hypothetical protein VJ692_14750, partial [Nitrospiraceae bacterium]|nr:hypothetical protein [Nitrospiraceae bacterium]
MPVGNDFQHAVYSRADPGNRVGYREYVSSAPPDSPAWQDAMAALGTQLASARIRAVVFLHGTFLGTDPFGIQRLDEAGGLKRGYSRGIPGVDALLALMREDTNGLPRWPGGPMPPFGDDDQIKTRLDEQVGDAGNFTSAYVNLFTKAIHRDLPSPISILRILWSCEHHHLGRAQAAIRLIHRLKTLCGELTLGADDRILIQAHGQAGLLPALISNLLVPGESPGRARFFEILKSTAEPEHLDTLLQSRTMLNGVSLDVVTLGTPVRYGWNPSGIGKLLHIINHRPMRIDGKRWLAKMELPQITMEMP